MIAIKPASITDAGGAFARASGATYVDLDGNRRSVGNDVLRPVLIEPAAQNRLARSSEFENVAWTKSGLTATSNAGLAADGTTTADSLVPAAGLGQSCATQAGVAFSSPGATAAVSVHLAPYGYDFALVVLSNAAGDAGVKVLVDIQGGRAISASAFGVGATLSSVYGPEVLANGNVRVGVVGSVAGVTAYSLSIYPLATGVEGAFVADGARGVLAEGAQLEADRVTSYFATTTAAAVRAADVFTGSGLVYSNVAETSPAAWSAATHYATPGTTVLRNHKQYVSVAGAAEEVAITIAAPGVVTWAGHGLPSGAKVDLVTTGALPTGLSVGTIYYLVNVTRNTFQLAATAGGAAITTSGTQSGIHTCREANKDIDPQNDALLWDYVGPSNRLAMFDEQISTICTNPGQITVAVKVGLVDGLAAFELEGRRAIWALYNGYEKIDGGIETLDGTPIAGFYDWFFADFRYRREFAIPHFAPYSDAVVLLTVEAYPSASASCGSFIVGRGVDLGPMLVGASLGTTDYSRKKTTEYGTTTIRKGRFSKFLNARFTVLTADQHRVTSTLDDLRSTPCAWIGSEITDYARITTMLAFFQTYTIDMTFDDRSYGSVKLESLGQ